MFVDEVDIVVRAGRGGDGCMSFLHEKYRPMGGPAGGNGGRGGSVVFQTHPGMRTLADFRGRRILVAKNGQPGEGRGCHGKSAKNLLVKVPVGTIIRNRATGQILADLTKKNQKVIVAKGGNGGRGNACFATSIDRTPRKFEHGTPGEEFELMLELRLLADVGLVGLPNAGKSTLIGVVSTVQPKVADYEFTTLRPSVGVVRLGDFASFTMADIPGLIAMAHQGKGLGHQFLRHIKRTSVICHLVEVPLYPEDSDGRFEKMLVGYKTIRSELEQYDEELALKPEVVCWTKVDILPDDVKEDFVSLYMDRFLTETGCPSPVHVISAVRGDGVSGLMGLLLGMLDVDPVETISSDGAGELLDGEVPEHYAMSELSMENLELLNEEKSAAEDKDKNA